MQAADLSAVLKKDVLMKASLRLEWIGAEEAIKLSASGLWGGPPLRKPWVAEIVGSSHSGKINRKFVDGTKDYSMSNGSGSRGVHMCYILQSDRLYEVNEYVSWNRSINYFCAVTALGDIKKLSIGEAQEWLSVL